MPGRCSPPDRSVGVHADIGQARAGIAFADGAGQEVTVDARQAVPVRASGKCWVATVRNPVEPGFVSLRAGATGGRSGTTLTQTVIRAYAVK
ncbi:hypothetical protein ACU635_42685 [[Actinomadura] parvosata]|uniref:hypothetical protein n=1 Tax=[Actinomadura] parvosata TaxID=1955412 RepID=UPI00406BEAA9